MLQATPELACIVDASRLAGGALMRRFVDRSALNVELKGPADFVSEADREAEDILRSTLLGTYPRFGFLTEESVPTEGIDTRARFIVDPLDGTTNFLMGIPHFAVSVALERDRRIVAGVVFDPAKDEMFVAEEGGGAWRFPGGKRMHVSGDRDWSRAVVGTGIPHANSAGRHASYLPMLAAAMREAAGIRRLGAAALDLAYVSAGRFAAFFEVGLKAWDLAAGAVLVREAGGRVTGLYDPSAESAAASRFLETGDVLATNGLLHESMSSLLRRAPAPPDV
ncbi:MAG TPA: inositol monophosphatase family protein [Polyangiaceae bacterium]|nr:inositol monophosphatase family protein [Polyangiaceae bacterium]